MSEANIEIVRRVYQAAARRDSAAVPGLYDPEVVFDFSASPFRELLDHHVFVGYDGLRNFFRERYELWGTVEDECGELIDAGDQVVAAVVTRGRGRTSGVETERVHFAVWTMRDGRVVHVLWFGSRGEALEAAGMSE